MGRARHPDDERAAAQRLLDEDYGVSGYLRSLVADAAVPGPRLRPIAVPFALPAMPALAEEATEIDAASSVSSEPSPRRTTTSAAGNGEISPRRDVTPAPLSISEAIMLLSERDPQPRPALPSPTSSDRRSVNRNGPAGEHVSRINLERVLPAAEGAPRATRDTAVPAAPPTPKTRITPIVRDPQPRRPAADVPKPSERARSNARDDSPPDVHIHIGRIEFTAVTAPPPRRQQASNAKPAMALDEYLKRRNGGTR
jgi:hypothetical protein